MSTINNREFFRLRFPDAMRPTAVIDDGEFGVAEISEGGMRIVCDRRCCHQIDDDIEAFIAFEEGEPTHVSGRIFRKDGDECIIKLTKRITLNRMIREQARVIRELKEIASSLDSARSIAGRR
ncbi:MAG: hypothetical protein HKN47_06695 [Pirellulaceae bacterium]|nr:hypothetical protein [Pirellulaceae bacterium]